MGEVVLVVWLVGMFPGDLKNACHDDYSEDVKKKKKKKKQLKELKKLKWVVVGYSQLCLLFGGGGIRDKQRETQRDTERKDVEL
jgi:hypothetical protein